MLVQCVSVGHENAFYYKFTLNYIVGFKLKKDYTQFVIDIMTKF